MDSNASNISGRLKGEGHYLGGLFHGGGIFKLLLRVLVNAAMTIVLALLLASQTSRVVAAPDCFSACTSSARSCCWMNWHTFLWAVGGIAGLFLGSCLATFLVSERKFLQSSLLNATVLLVSAATAWFQSVPWLLIVLGAAPVFLSVFAGYRLSFAARRFVRRFSNGT